MLKDNEIEVLKKIYELVNAVPYDYNRVARDAYLLKLDTKDYYSLNTDLKYIIDEMLGMNAGESAEFSYSQNELLDLLKSFVDKNDMT